MVGGIFVRERGFWRRWKLVRVLGLTERKKGALQQMTDRKGNGYWEGTKHQRSQTDSLCAG